MSEYSLKGKVALLVLSVTVMIFFPVVFSYTAEFPEPLIVHYDNRQMLYWDIRQITVSPIFDEPETTMVQFYFEKPASLFIATSNQNIYARNDTLWTYLIKHKQIQKNVGGYVFNPFDLIDSSQTYYRVIEFDSKKVSLKNVDQSVQPDSLEIFYGNKGKVLCIEYFDVNENKVVLEILDESFSKHIPEDNFLNNIPEGVELIDLSE